MEKKIKLSEELMAKISERIKDASPEICWSPSEEIPEKMANKIVAEKDGALEVEKEICEMNLDYIVEQEQEIVIEAIQYYVEEIREENGLDEGVTDGDIIEDTEQEYFETLRDFLPGFNLNIRQIMRSVNGYAAMYSNYDCINSDFYEQSGVGYSYSQEKRSYFSDIVDTLNLNPATLYYIMNRRGIKTLEQEQWPYMPERNGMEYVDYEKFCTELENTSCGANMLTFLCQINPMEFYDNSGKEIDKVTIPKGNYVGLYSTMQGGGSPFDMELLRDFTFENGKPNPAIQEPTEKYDVIKLETDFDGYSIKSCYGVTDDFFGSEAEIDFK